MKKLFNKIMSISIMSLGCMLLFVSFVKADGPDWLKVGSLEYGLFFKLSKDSQEKLIAIYKETIKEKELRVHYKKPSFINKLRVLDNLLANPSEETDKKFLPIVTGYAKKDNTVYINYSVFRALVGYQKDGVRAHFRDLDYKNVESLNQMTHFESIKSINDLFGNLCNTFYYHRFWSIWVRSEPIKKDEGTDFPSIYVSPSRLLNNPTNTNTSLDQQLQAFLKSLK